MQVSVELSFDSRGEARVLELWGALSRLYGGPSITELGTRPHISLTCFPEGEPEWLLRSLELLARQASPFQVQFASVESFPTSEGVVYLAPTSSAALRYLHGRFHEIAASHPQQRNPYYEPGIWIPHCTIATDVPDRLRSEVMARCREITELPSVLIERIEATAYRPARELYTLPLVGGECAQPGAFK